MLAELAEPDVITRLWTGAVGGLPIAAALSIAVGWFAKRENARSVGDREDRALLIATLETTKAANIEYRKSNEILAAQIVELTKAVDALRMDFATGKKGRT